MSLRFPIIAPENTSPFFSHAFKLIVLAVLFAIYALSHEWLMNTLGPASRILSFVHVGLAALFWGLWGGIIAAIVNTGLMICLHTLSGRTFEGGAIGPVFTIMIAGLIGRLRDMHLQIKTQLQERDTTMRSLNRLKTAVEQSVDGIAVVDMQGIIEFVNTAWARMHGFDNGEELMGRHLKIFHTDEQLRTDVVPFNEIVLRDGAHHGDVGHVTKQGTTFPTWMTSTVLKDENNRSVGIVGIARDITERIRTRAQLTTALINAEAANVAKNEFLANMSHELRTPMNAIMGMAQLLSFSGLDDEQREQLDIIQLASRNLLSIINDVLDVSKIEAGKLAIRHGDFDLVSLVEETASLMALQAHKKGVELICKIDPDIPRMLKGDADRLRQIILNILGNAVKFTEQGEIVITLICLNETQTHATLKFIIADTGIGIPEDHLNLIFQPFSQVDGSLTRRHGGTGLGLAITKNLVELIGGDIHVTTEIDKGAEFSFKLPFTKQQDVMAPSLTIPGTMKRHRILAIDDSQHNRDMLTSFFNQWGISGDVIPDADTALRHLYQAHDQGNPFSVIIAAHPLSEMDSMTFLSMLQADEKLNTIKQIVYTEKSLVEQKEKAPFNRVDAILTKPIFRNQLFECLKTITENTSAPLRTVKTQNIQDSDNLQKKKPAKDADPLRVLIVEDDNANQLICKNLIEKMGYSATVVNNGKEALDAIKHTSFDLVIMDIQMPVMNGIEATKAIRALEQEQEGNALSSRQTRLPIIALTAHAMKGERERFLAAGMDDYFPKPINIPPFKTMIKKHILQKPATTPDTHR
ncbi:MAG: response regulator [Thermodesulfobacteriota bacterium]|nr:response regulator [Thermodesulfobacteriota bacterium]